MMKKGGKRKAVALILAIAMAVTMNAGMLLVAPEARAAVSSSTYYIKVNKLMNTATVYVYNSGRYKPLRAMLVSCGGSHTPNGTFRLGRKQRWGLLMDNVKGQYCTTITGSILFHSVWYTQYNRYSQSVSQFNKLGSTASHGCVRLSVIDAKWIYDNCPGGTKVTIYTSRVAGPLGKPSPIRSYARRAYWWDPTDIARGNPYIRLRKPVISISKNKKTRTQYGRYYGLKDLVTARNPNARQYITSRLKVYRVYKWSTAKKAWIHGTYSTRWLGTYRIKYYVNDPYCYGAATAYFNFTVVDTARPAIRAAGTTLTQGESFGKLGIRASVPSKAGIEKSGSAVYTVTDPSGKTTVYRYGVFAAKTADTAGTYKVSVKIYNPYYKTISSTATYTVTVEAAAPVDPPVEPETPAAAPAAGESVTNAPTTEAPEAAPAEAAPVTENEQPSTPTEETGA